MDPPQPIDSNGFESGAAGPPVCFIESPVGQALDSHLHGLTRIEYGIQHVTDVALRNRAHSKTIDLAG